MGAVKNAALVVLGISFLTFVALFGRLPALRKTPIGFLHRVLWIHTPNGLAYIDSLLLGGRMSSCCSRFGNYFLHGNHPLILIFFVALLVAGEYLFVPSAWPRVSSVHRFLIPPVAILPYYLLYRSVVTKSFITPENHEKEMNRYPYDRILFHPGHHCRTCLFLKPARSKHCSFCKACVSRHDHHCIWLTNCVGLHNYRYFLSLLLSLCILLIYGSFLGYTLLHRNMTQLLPPDVRSTGNQTWSTFFHVLGLAVAFDMRVGTVSLLAFMTAPLTIAFLVYHTYLIWAGMTTNENAKWSEWKDDAAEGYVFKSSRAEIFGESSESPKQTESSGWPLSSDQILVLTTDGQPPKAGYMLCDDSNEILQKCDIHAPVDPRWIRVTGLGDIDNIYDRGFWDNLRDAVHLPVRRRKSNSK